MLTAKVTKWMRQSDVERKNRGLPIKKGIVVSILTDALAVEPHVQLVMNMMGMSNNFVCHSQVGQFFPASIKMTVTDYACVSLYQLSLAQIASLLAVPEVADVGIIQSDVVIRLLLLSLASSTISKVEVEDLADSCNLRCRHIR